MTDQHPITPPTKLIAQWIKAAPGPFQEEYIAIQAARWGADQELDACCEWIPKATPWDADKLRVARRPKPPSLKEQALEQLKSLEVTFLVSHGANAKTESIRRALESMPD